GQIVDFTSDKITDAMRKAFVTMNVPVSEDKLRNMTTAVVDELWASFPEMTPSVEHVQDRVELALMQQGYLEVAKHYIVYRDEHRKVGEEKKQEFLEKIEEEGLKITTGDGRLERYSEDAMRKTLAKFIEDSASVDVDGILAQLKYELYEGISVADLQRALIMV